MSPAELAKRAGIDDDLVLYHIRVGHICAERAEAERDYFYEIPDAEAERFMEELPNIPPFRSLTRSGILSANQALAVDWDGYEYARQRGDHQQMADYLQSIAVRAYGTLVGEEASILLEQLRSS